MECGEGVTPDLMGLLKKVILGIRTLTTSSLDLALASLNGANYQKYMLKSEATKDLDLC